MADDEALRLAELFGGIARQMVDHTSVDATLKRVVSLAVEHLHGCECAGVSLVQGPRVTSTVATGTVPEVIDEIQSELQEGPCFDAIRDHELFVVRDLTAERRWPRFCARAHAETGVSSAASYRLFIDEDTLGALNLYATRPDAFDDADIALGSVFAAHAAVALSSAQREENLERKAESRDLIGQAKGMLMAGSDLDDDGAFDVLRRASQRLNRKLVDVADDVVHRRPPEGR